MRARLFAPENRRNLTLAALVLAALSYGLQQTMVLPALPTLQRELHTTPTWSAWIFTGFLLSSAVFTPLIGKLGDQHGKARLLVISLLIFLVGCIGAASAWSIWSLIAFRIVQGTGAAVFPLSFAIINDEFPRERSGTAIGVISAVFGAAGGLGLPLSGLIVDNASWRWLFVVAAIVVATAAAAVIAFVPASPITTPTRLDLPGAALLSVILIAFLLALSEGRVWGWSSGRTIGLFVIAVVALVLLILVELRVDEPLVDMRVLAERTVTLTNTAGFCSGFALFAAYILLPQFVETSRSVGLDYGFGSSAFQAGLFLLPGAVLGLATGPISGRLGSRLGFGFPLTVGMILTAVGLLSLAEWHDRQWQVLVGITIAGSGLPFAWGAMAKLVVDAVKPSHTGIATGLNTVMRLIGGVVGGELAATLLANETIAGTSVPAGSAFTTAFWLSAAVALCGVISAFAVTRGRRRKLEVVVEAD